MAWESFYLLVFLVGLGLALGSLFLGSFHGLGGLHFGGGHVAGGHAVGHLGTAGGHATGPSTHAAGQSAGGESVSPINLMTLAAFLIWFGGIGYILATAYAWLAILVLVVAVIAGFVGSTIVFLFLGRILIAGQTRLNPDDYRLVGTLGHVSIAIHPAGTGEIVYVLGGSRKSLGARSDHDTAIAQGTEVVITRYEKGIAYVEPVEEYIRS